MPEHKAITIENISKCYRIGMKENMHDSIGGALLDFLKSPLRNYRYYRSLSEFGNIRPGEDATNSSIIWALKKVSFDVKQGEVVGIIGRNGAGKSTLLKVLSKIVDPTGGRAEIYGRISSLLEVGTGFHPELTGRENIYLNATLLGMRKKEVDRKFDEIVDFSGVEKFLDTPVKRYSSGMKVRLAFSVAAHLEPEILIIDEVLAVGDAAFQRKCLNKMEDVGRQGRTVLFVSHNMAAIANLCRRVIFLNDGKVLFDGEAKTIIDRYLADIRELSNTPLAERTDRRGLGEIKIMGIEMLDASENIIQHPVSGRELIIRTYYKASVGRVFNNCRISLSVHKDEQLYFLLSTEVAEKKQLNLSESGYVDFLVPEFPLSEGNYSLHFSLFANKELQDWVTNAIDVPVVDGDFFGTGKNYIPNFRGKGVLVRHSWKQVDRLPASDAIV